MSQPQASENNTAGLDERFLVHALTPANVGILPNPEGYAKPHGVCGDSIELFLRIHGDTIDEARFLSDGCLHTVACGSALTKLISGRSLNQAGQVGAAEIEAELGGLPKDHRHCAALAGASLKAAIRNYYKNKQAPWKGLYQKGGS